MKRWSRALLVTTAALLAVAGAIWLARPWVQQEAARRLAGTLGGVLNVSVAFDALDVSIVPPALRASRIVIGSPEAPLAHLREVAFEFDPLAWVISGEVGSAAVDLERLPPAQAAEPLDIDLPLWLPTLALGVGSATVAAGDHHVVAGPTRFELVRVAGSPLLRVDSPGMTLERGDERLTLVTANVEAEIRRRGIAVRSAEVRGDVGFVTLAGRAERDALSVEVDLPTLGKFLGSAERIAGRLTYTGSLAVAAEGTVSIDDATLEGQLAVDAPVWDRYQARSVAAGITLGDGRVSLRDIVLTLEQGRVSGGAEVELAAPHEVKGDLVIDVSDPSALAPVLRDELGSGPLQVHAELAGSLEPLSISGSLRGTLKGLYRRVEPAPSAGGTRVASPHGTLDADVVVEFQRLAGGTQATGTVTLAESGQARAGAADFELAIEGGGGISGSVKLAIDDARRLRPLAPGISGGKIAGDLALGGNSAAPRVQGTVAADNLDIAGVRFERIGGAFEADRESFLAKALELRALGGVARLDGRIALVQTVANDWRAKLEHVDLSAVWIVLDTIGVGFPYLTGIAEGEAVATGPWQSVDLAAAVKVGPSSVGTERLSSASLRASARAQKWKLDGTASRREDEVITLAGAGEGFASMWLSAWSTPWRVAGFRFFTDLPSARGVAVLNLDLYGRLDDPRGGIQLTLLDLGFGERDLGTLTAGVDLLSEQTVLFDLRDDAESLLVEGRLERAGAQPFKARAALNDFDLAHVLAPMQAVTMTSRGAAEIEGRLGDLGRSLSGELRLSEFSLGRDALQLRASAPIVVQARSGRFKIVSFDLSGPYGQVALSGAVDLVGTVALEVHIDADARVIEAIPRSPVKWASGTAALDARIRRVVGGSVALAGQGRVVKLSVDLGLPFLITDTNGGFTLEGSRVVLDSVAGRAGGGDFLLGGYLDIESGLQLSWTAKEVNSNFLDWLEDEVSGSGMIRGLLDALEISGDITVDNALYDRDVELADLLPIFRRELGPAPPKPGEKPILLDLRIRAPDSIYIDNNIARAEFGADLKISGSDLEPRISGEVELLDGEATILDRRFEVTLGRIGFGGTPKANPTLEFSANADVSTPEGEFNIVAEVGGTLDDPRVRLSADDSSLTTNDVVTLLTVGKTMAQLQSENTGGSRVSAGDLSKLAPMLYGSQVEREVKRYLPVDRFSVEPAFSRTTGDFEPRITVGTEITRGLRGTLSTTVAAQNQNSVQLEYQLTPVTLLVGSWESRTDTSEGGFGGAVKFRYRFRYLPFSMLPRCWREPQ